MCSTSLAFNKRSFGTFIRAVAQKSSLGNIWFSSKNQYLKNVICLKIKAKPQLNQNEVDCIQKQSRSRSRSTGYSDLDTYVRCFKNRFCKALSLAIMRCKSNSGNNSCMPFSLHLNNREDTFQAKDKADICFASHQFQASYTCKRRFHYSYKSGITNKKLHHWKLTNTLFERRKQDTNIVNFASKTEIIRMKSFLPQQCFRNYSKFTKGPKSQVSKRIKRILPHLFSENGEPLPELTVEKQLLGLMQMWAMEEAVDLLKESVESGVNPDGTVVLNLLQQLANLGEVECLLELHKFLKDRGLSTNLKFYHCLRDAYFNSGRVEDGILMLRVIYHGSRDFDDTDLLFTLLATMTAKHFEHMLPVVESYVTDLEESDPPVTSARASLWRCFVLAERFEKADILLEEFPEVKKMLPAQVTKLIQSQLEVDYDRDVVLTWLMNSPYVKPGLSASLFDMLILHKTTQGQWNEGFKYLSSAMSEGRKIHSKTVETFLAKFLNHLPQSQVEKLSAWANVLESLSEEDSCDS